MVRFPTQGHKVWPAIGLVAATYVYFLVFAQFGFLHRVRESLGQEYWNLVLGVMGLAGLVGALVTLMRYREGSGRAWLTVGFIGAGIGAVISALGGSNSAFVFAAFLSGWSLSVLTVSLVAVLARILPVGQIGMVCGLGTGVAYFMSNVPAVFEASPGAQCLLAALACLGGIVCTRLIPPESDRVVRAARPEKRRWHSLLGWVGVFMVLVWSDSAAFTRIQETPELRASSWSGAWQLWSIGAVHFVAAWGAGFLLDMKRLRLLLVSAFLGLFVGWLGLEVGVGGLLPALVYAAAVSLYSTALVGFALVCRAPYTPVVLAGVVYGISGWLGSAMGIGMVNDLGFVPLGFWGAAAALLVGGLGLIEREGTV